MELSTWQQQSPQGWVGTMRMCTKKPRVVIEIEYYKIFKLA